MAYLNCECGSGEFVAVVKLKTSNVGGVVTEVSGYACLSCKEKADIGRLLSQQELQQKAQELRQLTEEVQTRAAATGKKPGKVTDGAATNPTLPPPAAGPSTV